MISVCSVVPKECLCSQCKRPISSNVVVCRSFASVVYSMCDQSVWYGILVVSMC